MDGLEKHNRRSILVSNNSPVRWLGFFKAGNFHTITYPQWVPPDKWYGLWTAERWSSWNLHFGEAKHLMRWEWGLVGIINHSTITVSCRKLNMKFRNYLPHDKELQEGKLAPPVLPKFEDPVDVDPPPSEKNEVINLQTLYWFWWVCI